MTRRFSMTLALLLAAPAALSAQYFGQNKVQYQAFDFRILRTEHFDVHYYPSERVAAYDAARMAERSYGRLSRILNHRFRERKSIILYASHSDFSQTNTTQGDVGEGTGGFTDFFKQRNIMPLTGSYRDIEHVLTHEMVHQFQLDVFASGRGGSALAAVLQVQPPLWFMEGMAEFLSIGPTTPETAMWLRDAALEDKLPTIEQMTLDPRIFPYRYGHALWSYIADRWGDEAVGAILLGTTQGGIEASMKRNLGLTLPQLSQQWHDAIRRQYLPEIGERVKADAIAKATLNKARSEGTYHLAPAISPDGTQVAYFSEKDFYFVDLYLADVATGVAKRRLLMSTFSSNYETYRFINSSAAWSPDGKYLAMAAKRGPRDELLVLDVARNAIVRRIKVRLNGITTPSWSPDGTRIVFTGYDGGLSDLFVVNADGTGLARLTNDKYADLNPVWSPDGQHIAVVTDRGPGTDLERLAIGNYRIALFDVATGAITPLKGMDLGKNVSPAWAPDGRSFAFVSDRDGVSNIFLYDLGTEQSYQLTRFFTGAQGITALSPVLSWAAQADRLAFVYYQRGEYDTYTIDNPRALKTEPWRLNAVAAAPKPAPPPAAAAAAEPATTDPGAGLSLYRTPQGLRNAAEVGERRPDEAPAPPPVSIVAILDSADIALPDTSEFTERKYKVRYSPDYVQRPQIGYTRNNFGNGVFGGTVVTLSDNLGNHNLVFGGFVNGRIDEAQVLVQYANLSHRINWATGLSQTPYFFVEPTTVRPGQPTATENTLVESYRRYVLRTLSAQASYPFSRFQRLELGAGLTALNDSRLAFLQPYDPTTGFATRFPTLEREGIRNVYYATPSLALVYDNTLFGYTGPILGRRYRLEVAQSFGGWHFTQLTADLRRYDHLAGPFTLATRLFYLGRVGRDSRQFQLFGGLPDFVRGYTAGSYYRNECAASSDPNTQTGCAVLDQLIGSNLGVFNAELRFPIIAPRRGAQKVFPPVEGVLFFDSELVWNQGQTLKLSRSATDDPLNVRTPLSAFGAGVRTNLLGFAVLRLDYARPLNRSLVKGLWTLSLGPTF